MRKNAVRRASIAVRRIALPVLFIVFTYPCGVLLGCGLMFLRMIGFIRVRNKGRIPWDAKAMEIASNHPSILDPLVLLLLFFPECILHPFRYVPYIAADKKLFDRWFLFPLRSRIIFVPRGSALGVYRALLEAQSVLRKGGRVIIFPEGGRTSRGDMHIVYDGKRLRPLQMGVGRLAASVPVTIVPVWIQDAEKVMPIGATFPRFWKGPIDICVGRPLVSSPPSQSSDKEKKVAAKFVTEYVTDAIFQSSYWDSF